MRKRRLAQLLALLGAFVPLTVFCAGAAGAAANRAAQEPHYLYVGGYDGSGSNRTILRFALHDGLPELAPDQEIDNFGSLAGIARDGELYTEVGIATFMAFRPGASKPYRHFHIQLKRGDYVSASAVDAHGNFWVEYTYLSGDRMPFARPSSGALAFSPRAHGDVNPIKVLAKGGSGGLAFNSDGDMFIDGDLKSYAVEELTDILERPKLLKAYEDSYINDSAATLAIGSDGALYVRTTIHYAPRGVAVFAVGADPMGPPTNVIDTGSSYVAAIAAGRRYVYVINFSRPELEVYFAQKNGMQRPLVTLPIPRQAAYGVLLAP